MAGVATGGDTTGDADDFLRVGAFSFGLRPRRLGVVMDCVAAAGDASAGGEALAAGAGLALAVRRGVRGAFLVLRPLPIAGGSAEISIAASGAAEAGAFAAAARRRRGSPAGFAAGSSALLDRPRRFGDSADTASAGAASAGVLSAGTSGDVAVARGDASVAGSVPTEISGASSVGWAKVSTGASAAASTTVTNAVSASVSGAAPVLAERWRRRCEALAGFSARLLRGRDPGRTRGGRVVVDRGGFAIVGDPDVLLAASRIRTTRTASVDAGQVPRSPLRIR